MKLTQREIDARLLGPGYRPPGKPGLSLSAFGTVDLAADDPRLDKQIDEALDRQKERRP